MKVIKTLQLERDEQQDIADLRTVVESCNMAAAFFYDDPLTGHSNADKGEGTRSIDALKNGHSFELKHVQRAIKEVQGAITRLGERKLRTIAPLNMFRQYDKNLKKVLEILSKWEKALA